MNEYTKTIMDIVCNGKKIGSLVKKYTAEQYVIKYWKLRKLKRDWYENFKGCSKALYSPIVLIPIKVQDKKDKEY